MSASFASDKMCNVIMTSHEGVCYNLNFTNNCLSLSGEAISVGCLVFKTSAFLAPAANFQFLRPVATQVVVWIYHLAAGLIEKTFLSNW